MQETPVFSPNVLPRDVLSRYLPPEQVRSLEDSPTLSEARACLEHLTTLLHAICTYLPRHLVTEKLADPTPGRVSGRFHQGTLMFADISGFTAMSERLSRQGKAGAEEITDIVNDYFTAMLEITGHYGGDLLKFGGDALLVAFLGPDHAARACWAALRMQEAMTRFHQVSTSQGVFSLRMTIGLGTGPLFIASLGTSESMECTVMGPALSRMAHAEDQAEAGEIFVDGETRQAVSQQARFGEERECCHQLLDIEGEEPPVATVPLEEQLLLPEPSDDLPTLLSHISHTATRLRALEPYLPPGLLERLKYDPQRGMSRREGEFRPVTVLFANFYGIEEIIEQLGEERAAEITAILNAHFTAMQRIIAKYDGVVNKVDTYVVGHRVMALFGAPRAHVDDPVRAVQAALEMQDAMSAFAELETSGGVFSLKQRIGINTGRVYAGNVGSPTRHEYSVMGDEVNLTARLMAVAKEGQVLISQSTARQSEDLFLLRELPAVRVKGKSQPVPNYEVLGVQERVAHPRRERRPLIGRDAEWTQARRVADEALTGRGQILVLDGDVGMGKSRFIEELVAYWGGQGATAYAVTCPSYGRHTPYLPWIELLRRLFGLREADSDQVKQEKIESRLRAVNPIWVEWAALVGNLLGVPIPESDLLRSLDAKLRQQGLFRLVTDLVRDEARVRPLLLALDDLQWADEPSLALLTHIGKRIADRPLLLCAAHRPEMTLPLEAGNRVPCTTITLQELSDEASLKLLETLLPTTPQMPRYLKDLILSKAHGNPLFIEEVAHALIENYLTLDPETGTYRARADLAQIEVPDTVSRVIMSRIDRLDEPSRDVLKVASVIGKEFEYWLLSEIYPYRRVNSELRQRLDQLTQREILDGPRPELIYLFRHILTREVAYESLLYADRRELHRRIGESIEKQRAGHLEEYYEVLAHHYALAEDWEKALGYHLRAGEKAQAIYANEAAIHHFRKALEVAERVPESEDRQQVAHERLGEVLATVGEYDEALTHNYWALALVMVVSTSAEEMACRLADLCRKTASIHEKRSNYTTAFNWLRGGLIALEGMEVIEVAHIYRLGAGVYHRQGKNSEAIEWCHKSLAIAEKVGGREGQSAIAHAYYLLGLIYNRLGDTARTIEFCQKSIEIYEQIEDMFGASQAYINLANAYFDQGDWPRATEHYLRALEIKRKIGDAYGQAVITLNLGGVYLHQGDLDQAASYYRQSLEMWQELGSTYAIALLHNNMGAVALRRGAPDEALALLQKSLELFQQIGSRDFLPEVYRHMAEAHLDRGQLDKALSYAQRSLKLAQEQEMRLEEGATRRMLGQVHLARQELASAERELQESLRVLKELNSRYEVGKTLFQLAHLHRLRGEQVQMREALEQARAIFAELGARLDLAQAQELTP